jgi:hypothetical protein
MKISVKTAEIAAHLICHRPVVVLGDTDSGKLAATAMAMEIVSPSSSTSNGFINIDMLHVRRVEDSELMWGYPLANRTRFITKVQNMLNNNPDNSLVYSSIEQTPPEWVAPILEQILFSKRKIVLVGELRTDYYYHMPLLDRCAIVRM